MQAKLTFPLHKNLDELTWLSRRAGFFLGLCIAKKKANYIPFAELNSNTLNSVKSYRRVYTYKGASETQNARKRVWKEQELTAFQGWVLA